MHRFAARLFHKLARHSPDQTVYLTHLKWVSGKQKIQKYFSQFGDVQDVNMFFDSKTGLHRGFASVTFARSESARAVVRQASHVIDGDLVYVNTFMPVKEPAKNFKTM